MLLWKVSFKLFLIIWHSVEDYSFHFVVYAPTCREAGSSRNSKFVALLLRLKKKDGTEVPCWKPSSLLFSPDCPPASSLQSEQQSRNYHHFTKFISVLSKPLKSICKLWWPAPRSLHSFNSIPFYFIKYHPTVLFLFYVTMCGYYWSSFFQQLVLIFMYPQRILSVLSILPTPL